MNFTKLEPSGNHIFTVSSAATVAGGIALLSMGIYWLRPIPQPPLPSTPPPPPAPQVIVQKEYVPTPAPPQPPPPQPTPPPAPPPIIEPPCPWVGAWKIPKHSLPMLDVRQKGSTFFGIYAPPDWSGTYAFKDGVLRDGRLEFAIATGGQMRIQFRLEMLGDGVIRVENWMKPEDALVMLTNAVRHVRTPAQAVIARAFIEREIKRLGTPVPLGTFQRIPDADNPSERKELRTGPDRTQKPPSGNRRQKPTTPSGRANTQRRP